MRGCCELHVQSPGLKQTRYSNTGEHKVHSMQHLTGSPGHVFTCVGVGRPEMHLCFEIHVLQLKSVSECLQYILCYHASICDVHLCAGRRNVQHKHMLSSFIWACCRF